MANRSRAKIGAVTLLVAAPLIVTMLVIDQNPQVPADPVTVDAAERVLDEAVRLAQAGNYGGLCQSVALSEGTCDFLLRAARDRDLKPGPDRPRITEITRLREGRVKLLLQGTYPNGVTYISEFIVLRAQDGDDAGQLRTVTPVYWSPMGVAVGHCTTGSSGAACSVEPQDATS